MSFKTHRGPLKKYQQCVSRFPHPIIIQYPKKLFCTASWLNSISLLVRRLCNWQWFRPLTQTGLKNHCHDVKCCRFTQSFSVQSEKYILFKSPAQAVTYVFYALFRCTLTDFSIITLKRSWIQCHCVQESIKWGNGQPRDVRYINIKGFWVWRFFNFLLKHRGSLVVVVVLIRLSLMNIINWTECDLDLTCSIKCENIWAQQQKTVLNLSFSRAQMHQLTDKKENLSLLTGNTTRLITVQI